MPRTALGAQWLTIFFVTHALILRFFYARETEFKMAFFQSGELYLILDCGIQKCFTDMHKYLYILMNLIFMKL